MPGRIQCSYVVFNASKRLWAGSLTGQPSTLPFHAKSTRSERNRPVLLPVPDEILPAATPLRCGRLCSIVYSLSRHNQIRTIFTTARRRHDGSSNVSEMQGSDEDTHTSRALFLRTLNPNRLQLEDFVSLGGRTGPYMSFPGESLPAVKHRHLSYAYRLDKWLPFPADANGFLSWHIEPDTPALAGEVRFRVTDTPVLSDFANGHDLRMPDGSVWKVTLFNISRSGRREVIRTILLNEGLVTQDILDKVSRVSHRLPGGKMAHPVSTSTIIWRFNQPFQVRFEASRTNLWVVSSAGGALVRLHYIFRPQHKPLYKGSCLLQFECSTLLEHRNSRMVVLWIVKILEFGKSGDALPDDESCRPDEGQLLATTYGNAGMRHRIVWSLDIDAAMLSHEAQTRDARALEALFDYDEEHRKLLGSSGVPVGQPNKTLAMNRPSSLRPGILPERSANRLQLSRMHTLSRTPRQNGTRKSGASAHRTTKRPKSSPVSIWLRTLDPTKLQPSDFISVGGYTRRKVRVLDDPTAYDQTRITYCRNTESRNSLPFPAGTEGFLYWHTETGAPPLTSEIRLRVTGSADPASFSEGHDLYHPDSCAWKISIFGLARYKKHESLVKVLLADGLVTRDLLERALQVRVNFFGKIIRPASDSIIFWRFKQPFCVRFEAHETMMWAVGRSGVHMIRLLSLFRRMSEKNPPFTGVGIMQFERSTLPEHRGSRTVVLRIVKILSLHLSAGAALDDRLPLPEEGCLLQTRFSRGRGAYCVAPWSVDVDQSDRKEISTHLTALKVLFENEEELGKAAKPASSSR